MESKLKKSWNEYYSEGVDYIKISEELVNKIIESSNGGKKFLDLGCGTGDFLRKMESKAFETTGLEFSDVAIKIAKEKGTKAQLILQNLEKIDEYITENKFDIISSKLVLAFLNENKLDLLKWAKKHLTEGGIFVVISPISEPGNPYLKPGIEIEKKDLESLLNLVFTDIKHTDEFRDKFGTISTYICK